MLLNSDLEYSTSQDSTALGIVLHVVGSECSPVTLWFSMIFSIYLLLLEADEQFSNCSLSENADVLSQDYKGLVDTNIINVILTVIVWPSNFLF